MCINKNDLIGEPMVGRRFKGNIWIDVYKRQEMYKADVIVLACPVYFYTWPSLMKRMIDRTFAIEDSMDKKIRCV